MSSMSALCGWKVPVRKKESDEWGKVIKTRPWRALGADVMLDCHPTSHPTDNEGLCRFGAKVQGAGLGRGWGSREARSRMPVMGQSW